MGDLFVYLNNYIRRYNGIIKINKYEYNHY